MKTRIGFASLAMLIAVVLFGVMLTLPQMQPRVFAEVGNAPMNHVESSQSFTLYPSTGITTGTVYSQVPVLVAGADASNVEYWTAADLFFDVTGTGVVTFTPQFSPDGTIWADGNYEQSTGSAVNTFTYTRVVNAGSTSMLRVMAAGTNMRVKLVATGGTVTPTVKVVYRN